MSNLLSVIFTFGYVGLFLVIFAESGFLLGFFLPGDSLLFTAGFLASQGYFHIAILLVLCIVAAIAGDSFGYACGKKFGPKIFQRQDSFFFHHSNVEKTRHFYERYGKKTLVLARFIPVVRTFAPIFAGVAGMPYRTFFSYNVIGGIGWPVLMILGGYFLGSAFGDIEKYLGIVILVIVFLSFTPVLFEFLRHRRASRKQI